MTKVYLLCGAGTPAAQRRDCCINTPVVVSFSLLTARARPRTAALLHKGSPATELMGAMLTGPCANAAGAASLASEGISPVQPRARCSTALPVEPVQSGANGTLEAAEPNLERNRGRIPGRFLALDSCLGRQ